MKRLVLFCGLPASGKTTISKKLCSMIQAQMIDLDDFKKTEVDASLVRSQIDPPEVRARYYQKALLHAQTLYDEGVENIVMDEVFHLSQLRGLIEGFCKYNRILCSWIEIRSSYENVSSRLHTSPRIGHLLSTEETLAMRCMFENLFEDFSPKTEHHIIIHNDDSETLEEMTKRVMGHILRE